MKKDTAIPPLELARPPAQPVFFERGEVVHLHSDRETVLFASSGGRGAIVGFREAGSKRLEALIDTILLHFSGLDRPKFKLVGPEKGIFALREAMRHAGIVPAGEYCTANARTEIYFFSATGRLRAAPETTVGDRPKSRKVLLVDDSSTMRRLLRHLIETDPVFTIVGEAERPSLVVDMVEQLQPDLITLDIEMPEMDGITLLQKLTERFSVPVVMVSAVSVNEGNRVLKALELGAVDYIEKPSANAIESLTPLILEKLRAACDASVRRLTHSPSWGRIPVSELLSHPILFGASTGGVEALRSILSRLPAGVPPILIAQHIPPHFSTAFAERLTDLCAFPVREAIDGEAILAGQALLAPGGKQMLVRSRDGHPCVEIADFSPPSGYTPSVDLLMESAAVCFGADSIGVLLTGMGDDGASGLLKLRQAGAHTIAQDETSCVVYGMPRAAVEKGAAEEVLPLDAIADHLLALLARARRAA